MGKITPTPVEPEEKRNAGDDDRPKSIRGIKRQGSQSHAAHPSRVSNQWIIDLRRLWRSALGHDSRRLLSSMASLRTHRSSRRGDRASSDGGHWTVAPYPLSTRGLLLHRCNCRARCLAALGGAWMTEARGIRKRNPFGAAIALLLVILAAFFWVRTSLRAEPGTDDASIDGEVVHIAPLVGGRIIELAIHENQLVHKGDLLFRIDPASYQVNVTAAEANLDVARAAVGSKRRFVATQRWNADIATEQIGRAKENLALSQRTQERLGPLAAKGYIPQQQFDQAKVATQDATTSLAQTEKQQHAAESAVDTDDAVAAGVRAAAAALANARRALADTEVRAPHDGRIAGLTISTGEVVAPSQALFTLINTEEWFAAANFREIDLNRIEPGACVTVYSMIDRHVPIKGVVESIGYGVLDAGKIDLPRNLPYVEPSLNWVRVAQRFPVRIRLENPPERLVRLGASAIVEVAHGRACR